MKSAYFEHDSNGKVTKVMGQETASDYLSAGSIPGINALSLRQSVSHITPEIAREMLSFNVADNRNVSPNNVNDLAESLKAGRYIPTGSPIIISTLGKVIDGQHRLLACVKSGVPMDMVVISGVDPKAYAVIDRGLKRSIADGLRLHGYSNSAQLSSAAAVLMQWVQGKRRSTLISGATSKTDSNEINDFILDNPNLFSTFSAMTHSTAVAPKSWNSAWLIMSWEMLKNDQPIGEGSPSDHFLQVIRTGHHTGTEEDNKTINIRSALERRRAGVNKDTDYLWEIGMMISGWNKLVSGGSLNQPRFQTSTPIPEILIPTENGPVTSGEPSLF